MKKTKLLLLFTVLIFGCRMQNGEDLQSGNTSFLILDSESKEIQTSYEYADDAKTLLSTQLYKPGNELEKTTVYAYDAGGSIKSATESDAETGISNTINYKVNRVFDADGKLEKVSIESSRGETFLTTLTYDESGVIQSITEDSNSEMVSKKIYE